ncbi:hypothetical protein [Pseudoxanthomonas mexicana]|uniref:hypothetical protein n=1 Tax=Pseudoxanthomonas mexicana TaxID=128785 RepID=UPI001FD69C2A|nr:hypothetical protein [Pseudoxanthomonas mexicana]UOV01998.1 hypothetical protein MUU73_01500 [Pseudoxanthomonas mexicana]
MNADDARLPLWPLPLLIAVLFLVAAHAAYLLSIQAGRVPACMPYVEGCVSISRAARHGLGNHLFRMLVIPCAVLHALVWWLARHWLRGGRLMLALGAMSAMALAVYAAFLGTEGEAYRFLRRYGVVVYFGFGYLAQLALMQRAARRGALPAGVIAALSWIAVAMLGLGLANVVAGLAVPDPAAKDRWENVFEWWLGLLMVGWYAVLACGWKRLGLALEVTWRDPM